MMTLKVTVVIMMMMMIEVARLDTLRFNTQALHIYKLWLTN